MAVVIVIPACRLGKVHPKVKNISVVIFYFYPNIDRLDELQKLTNDSVSKLTHATKLLKVIRLSLVTDNIC